jgi:hypothetical protein
MELIYPWIELPLIKRAGAFVGNYLFPIIIKDAGSDIVKQGQYPFVSI